MKHARLTVIILSLTMLLQVMGSGWIEIEELEITPTSLEEEPPVMEATSPGHVVFAQYITSDNCSFCYNYGSPAHKLLKQTYADEYVYISYHSASFSGNPGTADPEAGNINPILGVSHLKESGGAPKTSFGDAEGGVASSTTYFRIGCGANTCWDVPFSSGGGMHSTVNDYSMRVIQSDNGDGTSDVLVATKYTGSGTAPSSLKLYAAVTEETCNSHVYNDGSKGGNCWEAWLLNGGAYASNSGNVGSGTGFQTISLSGNQWTNYTWTVPNNLVNGGAGNMNTIAALFGGWGTSSANENVYHATDSTMGPLVDVSIQSLEVSNDAGYSGYVNGDMLTIDAVIQNVGDEQYADGGTITLYQLSGSIENQIGSPTALNSLAPGATQSVQVQIDSSSFTASAYDAKFRARLTDLVADKNSGNNVGTSNIAHDMVPVANSPTIVGSTSVDRAGTAQVEVKAQSMDGVDNMSTMTPTFEFSPNGLDAWTTDGVTGGDVLLGAAAGNPRYEFFVKPTLEMNSGMYDVRVKFTDARGLVSDWAVNNGQSGGGAFELLNSLPTITVNPVPTVMVDVETQVSLLGHVEDEETALEDLTINSTSSSFKGWDPATGMMNVHFSKIQRDSSGNPTQSGIYLSVTDEDGGNSGGTLLFNVIENGMPRWAAVSPVTMNEASSTVVFLKNSLSDSNSDGTPTNGVDHLSLAIVGNDNADLLTASVNGFNLEIETVDDDATGEATLTVRASDGIQFSETTMKVYVQNVNDAPVLDISAFENITLFKGEQMLIDLRSHLSDADADQNIADLYVNVLSSPQIAALYSMQTGILTLQWEESGTQDVTITVVDDEDEVSSYAFSVEVISSLPLSVGKEDSSEVDVFFVGMDTNIGRTPSFLMTLGSEIGLLTDVQTEWQICNMETGLCYDLIKKEHPNANAATGWSYEVSFKRIVDNGGLILGDQIKLSGVSGVDANGVDRAMPDSHEHLYWNITTHPAFGDMESEKLETLISEMEAEIITLEEEIKALPEGSSTRMSKEAKLEATKTTYAMACNTEGVVCASDEVAAGGDETTTTMGSTEMLVYAGMGLFAIIIIALLSMLIVRRGGEPEFKDFSNMLPSHDHVANSMYGGADPIFQQQVAPAPVAMPPGVPPVPATGLPAGWTMEQWQYYGHQYLEQNGLE